MSSVLKRIKEIAKREGMSITALEASIGASKGVFSRALANGTDVQSKWLVGMAENYPQYSSEWLLVGKGEMLKGSVAREPGESYTSQGMSRETGVTDTVARDAVADALRQVITTQEKTIKALEKQIALLEKEIQNIKSD